jgi:hypothetical protein
VSSTAGAKQTLKALASDVLPASVFQRIQAIRSRRYQVKYMRQAGLLDQVRDYVDKHGTVVQSGPFEGLVYPVSAALNRWSLPKLIGSYELEIQPTIQKVAQRTYDTVIDIGSAEGYYAVGLARLMGIPVIAYEPEAQERALTALMAKQNRVSDLVQLSALFTADEMIKLSGRRAFVLCDCEGFEETLFTPDRLSLTRNWDLLIELHGTAQTVLPSLDWPHSVSTIPIHDRSGDQNELRNAQQSFLWCDSQTDPS